MRRPDLRGIVARYAVAWLYLAAFTVADLTCAALSPREQASVLGWASTNVHNLSHDPVGSLVASAFVAQGYTAAWPALIALAMFGACRVLGNWRTALVCATGHVIGTLVSEGIVGYRVSRGLLPASDRFIVDVGPSYVVMSAIVVALLYGPWLARAAAAIDLALLVFVGDIFGGLSNLNVAAVGHVTAIIVAALLGSFLAWQTRRRTKRPRPLPGEGPAEVGVGQVN
jgi:membrane associated rhomboid family serine protease